jgi:1-pyrroline-5-carboxylate dehydrogenase
LTGAAFAPDRAAIVHIADALRNAAGNFYVNDKAGSALNLIRRVNVRAIKETFDPPHDFTYPYMTEHKRPGI